MRKIISGVLAATLMSGSMLFSGGQALAAAPYCQALNPQPDTPEAAQLLQLLKQSNDPNVIAATILDKVAPIPPEQLQRIYDETYQMLVDNYIDDSKLDHLKEYQHKYDGKIQTRKDLDLALKDLTTSMNDRWTWSKSAADTIKGIMLAVSKQASLGINLRKQDDGTYMIEHVSYGSSAQSSGLREGDTVLEINGRELKSLDKDTAEALLVGPQGNSVKIKSIQDGKTVEASYTLRPSLPNDAGATLIENNLAYLKLPNFMNHDDFGKVVNSMAQMAVTTPGGLQGIVLDLRYNGGGEVDLAKMLIRLLMSDGVVIQELSRDGRDQVETKLTLRPYDSFNARQFPAEIMPALKELQKLPLVILVNGSSASAAEITTGALMGSRPNTVVIGEQTFGKFTEMLVRELPTCGSVAVTSGRYTTPDGKWLQNAGITPNVIVHQPRGEPDDLQMKAAIDFLKKKTAFNPANVVQRPVDTKEYFGPVPPRPQPPQADTDYVQLARENRTLLMQVGVGVFLSSILGIFLLLSRRRKDEN